MHSEIDATEDSTPPQSLDQISSNVLENLFMNIVTTCDSYDPSRFYLRYKIISKLRLVSRYWNHVIVSSPRLWQRIAIDVSSTLSRFPPAYVVRMWIDRTCGIRDLEILISMPSKSSFVYSAHAKAIMNVLKPEMHRSRELWYSSEAGVVDFPQNLSRAYNLTKISISAGIIGEDAVRSIGPGLHSLPGVIRDLDMDTLDFDGLFLFGKCYPMRWEHLERLTLRYKGWMQGILNILSDVRTSLISADIHVEGQWSYSFQYHTLVPHVQTISFAAIRCLILWIYDANVDLFEHLEMGSLEVIELTVNWRPIPERARNIAPLVNFIVSRSPSLQTCTMKFNGSPFDWSAMAFCHPEIMRLQTYLFYNIKLENVMRYAIIGSRNVFTRIRLIHEDDNPSCLTIGWHENGN